MLIDRHNPPVFYIILNVPLRLSSEDGREKKKKGGHWIKEARFQIYEKDGDEEMRG